MFGSTVTYPRLLPVVALALIAGCGKKDSGAADSCEKLGAHFAELAHKEADSLSDDSPDKKAAMAQLALLPKARASLVKECRDDKWSAQLRGCFLGAKSAAEFQKKCASLIDRVSKGKAPAAAAKPTEGPPPAADAPAADTPPAAAPADTPATGQAPTPAPASGAPQGGGEN